MKIMIKLLLLALVASLAAPFILKGPNGQPFIKLSDFIPDGDDIIKSVTPEPPTKLYKWKDAKGHWQFGDTPPQGFTGQEVEVRTPINSMKTIELPDGFKDEEKSKQAFDPLDSTASPLSTAPIEKVPEMLETIEGFQNTLDERNKTLDAL